MKWLAFLFSHKQASRVKQERAWKVVVTEEQITCQHPTGLVEAVRWDDLQAVYIKTTDKGPFVPDVFWIVVGSAGGCTIPQGATGEDELLKTLQKLEHFDNHAVIDAMSSCHNQYFLCWSRVT